MPAFGAALAGLIALALGFYSFTHPSRFGQFAWVICVTILLCGLVIWKYVMRVRRNRYLGHPERYKLGAQHKA